MDKAKVISKDFVFHNSTNSTIRLVLEPWGERYMLSSGREYHIVVSGSESGIPIMEWFDEKIVVLYAWPGSVISIFQENNELSPNRDVHRGS